MEESKGEQNVNKKPNEDETLSEENAEFNIVPYKRKSRMEKGSKGRYFTSKTAEEIAENTLTGMHKYSNIIGFLISLLTSTPGLTWEEILMELPTHVIYSIIYLIHRSMSS